MSESSNVPTVVRGACPHDCPDTCAWLVTVEDGVAVKLVGDPDHPITRGGLCAKVNPYLERVYSPERVLYPLRRVGKKGEGHFARVSWDEALSGIAARLRDTIAHDGPAAILPFSYLGTMGLIQGSSLDRRFFARLGATRLERSVCGGAGSAGVSAVNGTALGMLPHDLEHSRFIIVWGGNPIVTNLHLWPQIRQAKANGATIVVIDPVRTRTAAAADWHLQPLPGTDAALALGMMRVIVDEELHDSDYVTRYTEGFDTLRERLNDYPLDRVAALTGIPAEEIIRLARAYASTRPAAIRLLVGMEHHANGAATYRAIACLPALTGAWRERGGGLAYFTSELHFTALNADAVTMPELEDGSIRQVNMVQLGRILTDPERELDPPIGALIVYGSNPMATMPNQRLIAQGLARDDLFTVVHEQFLTDTARFADYVLPATTQVEHGDLMWSWGHAYVSLNTPAIVPVGEAIATTELFRRLAAGLGLTDSYLFASDDDLIRTALESDHPWLAGITWERLRAEGWARLTIPEPWVPYAAGGFPTTSGKAELGLNPLPAGIVPNGAGGDRYPLSLITAKSALHFLNSSFANLPRHRKAEGEPRLLMHADDATPRGIADGDTVRVGNERGELQLRARVGAEVRPGVVSMPSGWWPSLSPGGAANLLTPDGLSDAGGGGDFHDARVEVTICHAHGECDGARSSHSDAAAPV
ncbi:MAG: molybdopterin oxidoreductase family protein [Chloroflexota bacterium]|nr:molybdopterin oxidoreductase family protein [Chloroflexota bacterium]